MAARARLRLLRPQGTTPPGETDIGWNRTANGDIRRRRRHGRRRKPDEIDRFIRYFWLETPQVTQWQDHVRVPKWTSKQTQTRMPV
jgi:hypothetical protein